MALFTAEILGDYCNLEILKLCLKAGYLTLFVRWAYWKYKLAKLNMDFVSNRKCFYNLEIKGKRHCF